jgi:hypothetical protein
MEYLGFAARLVIGAIFVVAGATKLRHPDDFRRAVADYQILPAALVAPAARLLPPLEVALGAMLLLGVLIVPASVLAAVVLVGFAAAILVNVERGRRIGCGCGFGRRVTVSRRLAARNGALTALALASAAWPSAVLALYPGPGVPESVITPADAVAAAMATAALAGAVLVLLEGRRTLLAMQAAS